MPHFLENCDNKVLALDFGATNFLTVSFLSYAMLNPNPYTTRIGNPPQTPWETARIDFLRSQARALALSALPNLLRLLKLQEFPFYALSMMWTMMTGWAELCADEADRCGGIAGVLAVMAPGTANFNADEIPEVYE